jgi:protein-S-isoprenylcysteine O-methyltransferase Ste14
VTDPRARGTAWLFAKTSVFTLVVPGTVVVLVPYLLLEDVSLGAVAVTGISLLGLLPAVLGAVLYFRCAYDFALSGRGTPAPIDPPVELVVTGPYRYCRNPMYIGVLAILVGETILYRSLPLLYFLLAFAAGIHIVIISYEERALRQEFGEAYARYCETVPRWIPGWLGLKALYRETFLKVGTLVLAAGVVAHVLRLSIGLPVTETPDSLHAFLVVLPAYAVFGCIVYARQIDLAGVHRKIIFALTIALLLITVVMHIYSIVAQDNQWLGIFPMWYSVFAVIVYGGFAYFLKTRSFITG